MNVITVAYFLYFRITFYLCIVCDNIHKQIFNIFINYFPLHCIIREVAFERLNLYDQNVPKNAHS